MGTIQVDRATGLSSSAAKKAPCFVATGSNITLSGEQTIDGELTAESRVLVRAQTDASENGIYNSSSSAWTRAPDWQESGEVIEGTQVWVTDGATRGVREYVVTTADDIVIGTTDVTISEKIDATGYITAAGVETLSNKTLTAPVINGGTINSPDMTGGTPLVPTAALGTANTQAASTGFVDRAATQLASRTFAGSTDTLVAADAGGAVRSTGASAATITIPPNSDVPIPVDTWICVEQYGSGQVDIAPGSGVTLRSTASKRQLFGQYTSAWLHQIATDEWMLFGDIVS
jgi:uncharacterized cupin superfamily protein